MRRMLLALLAVLLWTVAPASAQERVICVEGCSSTENGATEATADDIRIAVEGIQVAVEEINTDLNEDGVHANTVSASGPAPLLEGKDFDGAALPNAVTEGQGVRQAGTLSGITFTFLVNEDGSKQLGKLEDDAHASADYALPILTRRRDTAAASAGAEGDYQTADTDGLGRLWVRNGNPCADHARITHAVISESTAATNEIVALNGSDLIYVCAYKWVTTAANSLNWTRGTGSDCGTGTTAIEGAQPYAANGGVAETGGGSPLFVVPAGNALCLVSSVATAHGGRVSYVRTAAP
jgi:hypothetical protein